MAEYIEREAARKLACKICGECDGGVDVCQFRDIDVDAIHAADVRPVKRGKWTKEYLQSTRGGTYSVDRCSECGASFPMYDGTPYCPNCGADMREES